LETNLTASDEDAGVGPARWKRSDIVLSRALRVNDSICDIAQGNDRCRNGTPHEWGSVVSYGDIRSWTLKSKTHSVLDFGIRSET